MDHHFDLFETWVLPVPQLALNVALVSTAIEMGISVSWLMHSKAALGTYSCITDHEGHYQGCN